MDSVGTGETEWPMQKGTRSRERVCRSGSQAADPGGGAESQESGDQEGPGREARGRESGCLLRIGSASFLASDLHKWPQLPLL